MENVVYFNELYDLYGELLTDKQRAYFEDYYFNNLSFSEIAENYDISRNAAFKQIHIVTSKLEEYENILKLREKRIKLLDIIKDAPEELKDKIENII